MKHIRTTPANLTQSTARKRGRHAARHRLADGTEIEGLKCQKDGRWRISATNEFFTEPDERLAVARFEATMAKLEGQDHVELPLGSNLTPEAARNAAIDANARKYVARIGPEGSQFCVPVGSQQFYAAVREMLINDPIDLSLKTGVEWVARGADLPRPTPSPTMQELIDCYAAKTGVTSEEITRCKRFWKDFAACVDVKTIRDLNHERVARYERQLSGADLGPKSIKHRYTRIKTVIAFAMKRGKNPDDCQRALNVLKMLETPEPDALDPNPITPADFWAVYQAAEKANDEMFAALMLFSLNAALYPSEVGAVKWIDIDLERGEFSSRRNKTRVPRVATLWAETVAALKKMPRDRVTVFNTVRQRYTRMSVFREWKTYRTSAGKAEVLFNQIRDAAFTIACRADPNQARVLAGHRLPGSVDNYVKRNPGFVENACQAIHKEFAVGKHAK